MNETEGRVSNLDTQYKTIYATAVELAADVVRAQEMLREHIADAKTELITEGMDRTEAKAIRQDLAEIKALALIEARGEEARRAANERVERRRRISHVVGVQLDLDV